MLDLSSISMEDKNKFLDSAPDIWGKLKNSISKKIAEQLIEELNGVPSNCGKLVSEQVNDIPGIRKVA